MARLCRLIAFLFACLIAMPALSEKRVALVIGNSAYKHAPPLSNPKNDAEGIAAALKRLEFDVSLGIDLDKAEMQAALRGFERKLDGATVALVFYAGHGLQVNGENYVVPVDAKLEREGDLRWEAISLGSLMQDMEQTRRTNIVILDACRDNPLARSLARSMGTRSTSVGRGLASVQGGTGTMIVFATGPNNVALDGDGARNSPFTAALLRHIETPGIEVRQVLTRVRVDVARATSDKQVPWVTESLLGEFFFAAAAAPTPPAPDQETVFWQSIRDSKSAGDHRAYLERWPNGVFAPLAKARIAELEKAASVEPPKPAPEPARPGIEMRSGQVFRDCPECPEMVAIPRGTFTMGSPLGERERSSNEGPQRSVTVGHFALGKYEVTFAEYDACVAAGACTHQPGDHGWGRGRRPVIDVSWDDARQYVAWLSRKTGRVYRLPSEAEWEYAARAGAATRYSWGNDIGKNKANCRDCGSQWDEKQTAPVGSFAANRFGLHDMHGNVWEWVEDCWNGNYSGAPGDGRAWLAGDCSRRVLRGGSWSFFPWILRAAYRFRNDQSTRNYLSGFRVARTP